MNWKVLKTENDYINVTNRLMEIFQAEVGSPEHDELELLIVLVKDYDDHHYQLPTLSPLDAIKYKMEEKGLKAKDLEPVLGSKGHVSSILSGRRELTLKTAKRLKDFFELPAELFFS